MLHSADLANSCDPTFDVSSQALIVGKSVVLKVLHPGLCIFLVLSSPAMCKGVDAEFTATDASFAVPGYDTLKAGLMLTCI